MSKRCGSTQTESGLCEVCGRIPGGECLEPTPPRKSFWAALFAAFGLAALIEFIGDLIQESSDGTE